MDKKNQISSEAVTVLTQLAHHTDGPLTRLQLAKLTNLSPINVNKYLNELIDQGYVMSKKKDYHLTGDGSIFVMRLSSATGTQTDNPRHDQRITA